MIHVNKGDKTIPQSNPADSKLMLVCDLFLNRVAEELMFQCSFKAEEYEGLILNK